MQVLSIDLDNYVALFYALLWIGHFLVFDGLALVVFADKDQTFTIATGRDEHHMHDIIVVKILMVNNFLEALVGEATCLSLILLEVNEVVNQVGTRLNLGLLAYLVLALHRQLIGNLL